MPHRVLLAGLFHETHTFLEGRTPLSEFDERVGNELWDAENDGSPLAGALRVARECAWDVLPVIDLRATPGPTVDDAVVERFWLALDAAIAKVGAPPLDGVYLVLHGAMVSVSLRDVEGEILSRLRSRIGPDVPICGVLDLHGNITERLAQCSQGFVAYRQNPHADACAAARDGALLLDRLMRTGEQAVTVWQHPPVLWPPTGTGTAFDPMKTLEAMAREIESRHEDILAVNVFAGFSFADTPETGVSFTAVTVGDPAIAKAELEKLSAWTVAHRELGNVLEEPLDPVLKRVADPAARIPRPVVLAEPSDNIGGGAPGDGTALLKALLAHRIENAAVAICDAQAVDAFAGRPAGTRLTLDLGGRGSPLSGGPLRLEVELLSTSDGKFTLEDPHSHLASMSGHHFDMGPCVVVQHAGVKILLTSRKTPPFDLGQWRSQGIVPEKLDVIGVKAAVAHRKVYDPIAGAHYTVETPGPCSSNMQTFPFRFVRRPIFPLDA